MVNVTTCYLEDLLDHTKVAGESKARVTYEIRIQWGSRRRGPLDVLERLARRHQRSAKVMRHERHEQPVRIARRERCSERVVGHAAMALHHERNCAARQDSKDRQDPVRYPD